MNDEIVKVVCFSKEYSKSYICSAIIPMKDAEKYCVFTADFDRCPECYYGGTLLELRKRIELGDRYSNEATSTLINL